MNKTKTAYNRNMMQIYCCTIMCCDRIHLELEMY